MTESHLVFTVKDVEDKDSATLHEILDAFIKLGRLVQAQEHEATEALELPKATAALRTPARKARAKSATAKAAARKPRATTKAPPRKPSAQRSTAPQTKGGKATLPQPVPSHKAGERWWTGADQAENRKVIRAWAEKAGHQIGARGGLPAEIVAEFMAANGLD
jgi:hypothetical protein